MKVKTKLISKSDAAKIYLDWFSEEEIKKAFRTGSRAQQKWDDYLRFEFQPYVPMDTGMLIRSAELATTIGSGEIIYNTPYSKYLYYGKLMVDRKTGSAYAREGVPKELTATDLKFSNAANKKAGSFWDRRAANDRFDAWKKTYAAIIAKGFSGK